MPRNKLAMSLYSKALDIAQRPTNSNTTTTTNNNNNNDNDNLRAQLPRRAPLSHVGRVGRVRREGAGHAHREP